MKARTLAILLVTVLLTACATVGPTSAGVGQPTTASPTTSPTPSDAAQMTPPPNCVNPPPDIVTIIAQSDPLACYGNAELTVAALLTSIGVADCPGGLQPSWFSCEGQVALNPLPVTSGGPPYLLVVRSQGKALYAVLHPDIESLRSQAIGTMVRLTGHFDDFAAVTCHYTSWPDANPPSPQDVVHMCRSTFVISAMELYRP